MKNTGVNIIGDFECIVLECMVYSQAQGLFLIDMWSTIGVKNIRFSFSEFDSLPTGNYHIM